MPETIFNFPISGKAIGVAITTVIAAVAGWLGNGILGTSYAGSNAELQTVRAAVADNASRIEKISDLDREIKENQSSNERNFKEVDRTLEGHGEDIDSIKHDVKGVLCFLKKQNNIQDPKCGLMGVVTSRD